MAITLLSFIFCELCFQVGFGLMLFGVLDGTLESILILWWAICSGGHRAKIEIESVYWATLRIFGRVRGSSVN